MTFDTVHRALTGRPVCWQGAAQATGARSRTDIPVVLVVRPALWKHPKHAESSRKEPNLPATQELTGPSPRIDCEQLPVPSTITCAPNRPEARLQTSKP